MFFMPQLHSALHFCMPLLLPSLSHSFHSRLRCIQGMLIMNGSLVLQNAISFSVFFSGPQQQKHFSNCRDAVHLTNFSLSLSHSLMSFTILPQYFFFHFHCRCCLCAKLLACCSFSLTLPLSLSL
jgi:hypothetical protein